MKNKVSVAIITLNEAAIIEQCLQKLNWVDEIIVVDSGSTDATVALCEKYNAKVIYNKFEGYGKQKQFAVAQTKNDWVLSLDADEVLSDTLIKEIKKELEFEQVNFDGFYVQRQHVFMNRPFRYGYESKRYFLRLFNKTKGNFNSNLVHESIELKGATKKLKAHFLHYSYLDLNSYISKLNNYTDLYAKTKFLKGEKYSVFTIILKTKFEFFKKYFIDLNFLNGKEGLYWSIFSTFYTYTKCVKTNSLYQ